MSCGTSGELEGCSETSGAEAPAPGAWTRCKPTPGLTLSLSNFSGGLFTMQIPGSRSEEQIQCGPGTGRWSGSLWSRSLPQTPHFLGIVLRPILLEAWERTG